MAKVRRIGRLGEVTDASVSPPDGHCVRWNATIGECEFRLPNEGGGGPHAASHQDNGTDEISVAGLSGLLADPQTPASHGHAPEISAAVDAHEAASDPHAGYQRETEKAQANGYASLGADGKVPAAQLPASGGADPWTRVVLGSNFSTSGTANVAVTGLNFVPAAGKRYLVEVYLLLRTATATVGARPGFSWPTGLSDGGAWLQAPNSATAYAMREWGAAATQNAASTGLPDTTASHLAIGGAYFIMGASPSGSFGVTLASETSGTSVTVRAGSVLMYREI